MKLQIGNEYNSIETGSTARVVDVDDEFVTFKIVYHPDVPELVGKIITRPKDEFIKRTERYNIINYYNKNKRELKL